MANLHAGAGPDTPHHEERDVDIRAIFRFGGGLVVSAAVIYVLVWLLFLRLSARADRSADHPMYPLAAEQRDRVPPEPRLQTHPREDLQQLRDAENQILGGYRWVDRNAGIVRIPIDEAIRLTLERGLPSRDVSPQDVRR